MNGSPLKIGVIGLGVGERHADELSRNPRCELVAVCDFDDDKIAWARSKYGSILVTRNVSDILDHDKIDVVVVASYDNYHYEQIIHAVRNGKHVFVEKPLCLFEEEAKGIRGALDEKPGIHLSSNLILRKYPRFLSVKKMIDRGDMGDLFAVEGDYNYGRLHKIIDGWRGRIDFYSVVYGGGVHIIDLLLWLTGKKVVEVAAFGNNICSAGTNFRYNDMVVSVLKFSDGMVGKVSANFGCVYPHFHKISIYGTKATFENTLKEGVIYGSRDPMEMPLVIAGDYPGVNKGSLASSFVDAIYEGKTPDVSTDDVFSAMSVCFAIEQSVRSGRSLPVTYI